MQTLDLSLESEIRRNLNFNKTAGDEDPPGGNPSAFAVVTQSFIDEDIIHFSTFESDDFTVPDAGWDLSRVKAYGIYGKPQNDVAYFDAPRSAFEADLASIYEFYFGVDEENAFGLYSNHEQPSQLDIDFFETDDRAFWDLEALADETLEPPTTDLHDMLISNDTIAYIENSFTEFITPFSSIQNILQPQWSFIEDEQKQYDIDNIKNASGNISNIMTNMDWARIMDMTQNINGWRDTIDAFNNTKKQN